MGHGRRALLALAAALVAVIGPPVGAQESEAELELRLRQAERKLEQGDTVGALLDVEAVLARDDEFWRAYFARGRIQARMGDDLGARDSFTRAAELDPGNGRLHYLVAAVALQLADFESAAHQLEAAAQAGYDPAAVDGLAESLRGYVSQPLDLETIRAAPRVTVAAVEDDPPLERLVRELRTLLLDAPEVALVPEPDLAHLRIRLSRIEESGQVRLEAVDRRSDEVLIEHTLSGDGAEALVELGELLPSIVESASR